MPRTHMERGRDWEQMGAATGLLATALLALGIVMGWAAASTPTGQPDVADAQSAPAFLAGALTQTRLMVLFTSLGLAMFLWFFASLWTRLKEAEGEPARGTTAALAGAISGTVMILVGLLVTAAMALSGSPAQAASVPALYVVASLATALGGGMLSLFFFGTAKVILNTGALGRWLGWLALAVGLLCVLTFTTPFFNSGALDSATGVLGHYAWFVGFVAWLFLASIVLVREQRASGRRDTPAMQEAAGPMPTEPTEGA